MNLENSLELKQLQTRKRKLQSELLAVKNELDQADKKYHQTKAQLDSVLSSIKSLKTKEIIVTEHAIIRYLERSMGIDIEQIRNKILSDETRNLIKSMDNGNGKYPIGGGCKAVVKDGAIVSII